METEEMMQNTSSTMMTGMQKEYNYKRGTDATPEEWTGKHIYFKILIQTDLNCILE